MKLKTESETECVDPPLSRVAEFCTQRRVLLLCLSSMLCLLLAPGILRLDFDSSLGALLSQSDPYLDEFERVEEAFPPQLEVNFGFVADAGETVFTPEILDAIAALEARFRSIPQAQRFSSITDYFSPDRQERLFTRELSSYSPEELTSIAALALGDRILTGSYLSPDGRFARATIAINENDLSAPLRIEIAEASMALVADLRSDYPNVNIVINSDVLLEQDGRQAMFDDLSILLPIVIVVCIMTICLCFRSLFLGGAILVHIAFTVVSTLGTLGYLQQAFNSISVMAPLVVVIIAVANSVHIISLLQQDLARGRSKHDAMRFSLSRNLQPITLAALTTAIGFSSLNMSSSPSIQDFGRIVALGIVYAYFFTLTVLPAVLTTLTRVTDTGSANNALISKQGFLRQLLQRITRFAERRDKQVFISFSVLSVIGFALLPLNETDFNRLAFIDDDTEMARYYDAVAQYMDRGPTLSYAIDTGVVDGGIEPDFLQQLEIYQEWLADLQGVESAASVVDMVKTISEVANENDPAAYTIPPDIDSVAYYLNSYEVVQSEEFPLSGFVSNDFSIVTLIINARTLSNQDLLDLDAQITQGFANHFSTAELLHGSGLLLFARMDQLVTFELMQGYTVSLLLITLCLIVGLRSWFFGILSIIPNLLPAVIVFGGWGLLVGQIDPFVMMLFSISIGLVVDDTVHILSHYLENRQLGSDQNQSILQAVSTAGPALTITTMVLALGTTILIAANTLYFQQSAKLLVPIVVLALVLDLLYLPTILRRCDKRQPALPPKPVVS